MNPLYRNLDENSEAKLRHMQEKMDQNDENLKKSMKGHLSALNDGIIAIFITVMMLEIPFPASRQEYRSFIWSILIFFVSFFVIADFWYENKRTFEAMREADHLVIVMNFLFLAMLALIPVMTKWILNDPERMAVVNYGIVFFLARLFSTLLYFTVVRKRFRNHMNLFVRITLSRIGIVLLVNLILIIFAWFFPAQTVYAYVLLPVISFFRPDHKSTHRKKCLNQKQEVSDAENSPDQMSD